MYYHFIRLCDDDYNRLTKTKSVCVWENDDRTGQTGVKTGCVWKVDSKNKNMKLHINQKNLIFFSTHFGLQIRLSKGDLDEYVYWPRFKMQFFMPFSSFTYASESFHNSKKNYNCFDILSFFEKKIVILYVFHLFFFISFYCDFFAVVGFFGVAHNLFHYLCN